MPVAMAHCALYAYSALLKFKELSLIIIKSLLLSLRRLPGTVLSTSGF